MENVSISDIKNSTTKMLNKTSPLNIFNTFLIIMQYTICL